MSTIAIAVTVTVTSNFTASTLPPSLSDKTSASRTMANTDKGITDLAEKVRQLVRNEFVNIIPNTDQACTVAVTVTQRHAEADHCPAGRSPRQCLRWPESNLSHPRREPCSGGTQPLR